MAGMAGLCALVALPAAWLTGCSDGDMLGGMGSEVEPAHGRPTAALPGPGTAESTSNALVVSPRQQDYLDALHTAVQAALAEPDIKRIWAEQGARIDLESRQAFGDFVKAEVERWSAIARTTGLPME